MNAIFKTWFPLSLTWLLMAAEGPIIASFIARLEGSKENLAAYGVAFSMGLLMEAPVVMIMSAAVKLVKDSVSYFSLRNYTFLLCLAVSAVYGISMIPSVFKLWTQDFMGLTSNVSELTFLAMAMLCPWPGMIGYRRFYQGILIRMNRSRYVALGTWFRLVTIIAAMKLCALTNLPGAAQGCIALAAAVTLEAIIVRWMSRSSIRSLLKQTKRNDPLPFKTITHFYTPLVWTALLGLAIQPIVTLGAGQAKFPLESLAVLPVVSAFVFVFRGIALSYQEVVISMMGRHEKYYSELIKFAYIMAIGMAVIYLGITFSPLVYYILSNLLGLSDELAGFAVWPLRILAPVPILTLLYSWQKSMLIHWNQTAPITSASITELASVGVFLVVLVKGLDLSGAIAAAFAMMLSRLLATIYLQFTMIKQTRNQLVSTKKTV